MRFIDNLLNGNSSSSYFERAAGRLGTTIKNIANEQLNKYATDPIRNAIGKMGSGALGDFFEGFFGIGDRSIPNQYTGTTDQVSPEEDMFASDKYVLSKYNIGSSSEDINDSHPMLKYMFIAEFKFSNNEYYRTNLMNTFPKAMTLALKNTTFPRVELETEELNQYNRPKIATKKVNYQPITASFGESVAHLVDGKTNVSMLEIWESIASYYINDFRNDDSSAPRNKPFGHRSGNTDSNLIKYIDLYFIWPSSTKRLRLVNPYITSFSYDALDYSLDDQIIATFDIKYEYYDLKQVRGNFFNFINQTTASQAIKYGAPPNLDNAQSPRNFNIATINAYQDNQRNIGLDNIYAQTAIDLAEQESILSVRKLLGSSDPIDRELGEAVVREALDAGKTIAEISNIFEISEDSIQGIGRSANMFIRGLF